MDLKKRVSKHFVSGLLLAMVAFAPLFAEADSKVEARGNHFLSQYIKAQTPFALNKLVDAFIGAREIISQKNGPHWC